MDHDATSSSIKAPASLRRDDVRNSYMQFVDEGLRVLDEQIDSNPAYLSNADGHFAWDLSLSIRAACSIWRATGDRKYLAQATRWAAHICNCTDLERGVLDWRGRSRNVWSAGSRYTAGIAVVGSLGDQPIRIQAAADAIVIEKPTIDSARVHAIKNDKIVWSPPEGSLVPSSDKYLPDVLALNSSVSVLLFVGLEERIDLSGIQAGTYTLESQQAPHLVHTGLIARSLLAVAAELDATSPGALNSATVPAELYRSAELSLSAHDSELRIRSGHRWYVTPTDFPGRRLGMELPHNQVVDAATSLMLIGDRTGNPGHVKVGRELAGSFLREIASYQRGALEHPWWYYRVDSDSFIGGTKSEPIGESVVRPAARAEDSSHATMRIRALADWRAIDDSLVPDQALKVVAASFRDSYLARAKGRSTLRWLPGDAKGAPRMGSCDTYVGSWGKLSVWDSRMRRTLNGIAAKNFPLSYYGATILSAAEIVEMNSR